jgi:ABC-type nitrate/sulfonate/bicarbonate transport system substrate-binding protein
VIWASSGCADLTRAFAASAIKIALSAAATDTLAIARGVPLSVIGNLQPYDDFAIWSSSKGHINKGEDLKGGKIGVSRFGGLEHSYAQLAAKKFGIDKDVQYVSTGGINESLAALVTGSIDAVVLPVANMLASSLRVRSGRSRKSSRSYRRSGSLTPSLRKGTSLPTTLAQSNGWCSPSSRPTVSS